MESSTFLNSVEAYILIAGVIGSFAVNGYMTKKNTSEIKSLKETEIAELYKQDKDLTEKVNKKIDEDKAREIFVTKELNVEQMRHIDTTMTEIKEGQKEILEYLRK